MKNLSELDRNLTSKIPRIFWKVSISGSFVALIVYLSPLTHGRIEQFYGMVLWLAMGVAALYYLYTRAIRHKHVKYGINFVLITVLTGLALILRNPEIFSLYYFIMAVNVSFRDRALHFISSGIQIVYYVGATFYEPLLLPSPTIEDTAWSLMITRLAVFITIVFIVDILHSYNLQLTSQLFKKEKEITMAALTDSVESLVQALEAKDQYTNGHSQRVSKYSLAIAGKLGLSSMSEELFHTAGLLHDIGKIAIPDQILSKPGRLTEDEFNLIKEHPLKGAKILENTKSLQGVIPMVLYHHEHHDGKGYPHGLQGLEIPLEARILAVADAFDAMTSNRPYRKALTPDEALKEVVKNKGTQFCPVVVDAFEETFNQIYLTYMQGY